MKPPASSSATHRLPLLALAFAAGCGVPNETAATRTASPNPLGTLPAVPAPPIPAGRIDPSFVHQDSSAFSGGVATGGDVSLPAHTLILYDTTDAWGYLGELYAIYTANLVSHFGTWTTKPVGMYRAGDVDDYTATIYLGSTYGEPLPPEFLSDVLATQKPVIWVYDNIWQLVSAAGDANFRAAYGWDWLEFGSYAGCPNPPGNCSPVSSVSYKGQSLIRDGANNQSGIMDYSYLNAQQVTVLATANRDDGTTFPWAVRSNHLTYIGEMPMAYAREGDRVLIFADLLFDALAPATATRHRATLRLEDVDPTTDVTAFNELTSWLKSKNVPFAVGVIPVFTDPLGCYGAKATVRMSKTKSFIAALKDAQSRGGTLILHGYTHQHSNVYNPYSGVSADDFEFYAAHIADRLTNACTDTSGGVVYDGPVAGDSAHWATGRYDAAIAEFKNAGLAAPTIFEFPHYAASQPDYTANHSIFKVRYERALYFGGALTGGSPNYSASHVIGQYFPYVVTDLYGAKVLPEDLGNYEPTPFNTNPARTPSDIIAAAQRNLVVRDGVAASFFHPSYYYSNLTTTYTSDSGCAGGCTYDQPTRTCTCTSNGVQALQAIVTGIQDLGYTFVAPSSL